MNVALAVPIELSVAVTVWLPATDAGTVRSQLNAPVASMLVPLHVTLVPSHVTVYDVALAAYPEPVTVTVVPTAPVTGDSPIAGCTVIVADALFAGVALSCTAIV